MQTAGRVPRRLLAWGVPLGPLLLLQTRGRRSGTAHLVPVAVLDVAGERWLISAFGEVSWVRNVRSNGIARLGRGRDLPAVHLTETTDERVPALLRMYRRRFAVVPFVRAAFDATGRDDTATFAREAHRHPVFRVDQRP